MRKSMCLVLAVALALTLLAGCGEQRNPGAPSTALPGATDALPGRNDGTDDAILPDPKDGEVRDTDGIIDDHDSGAENGDHGNGETGQTRPGTTDGTNRTGK